MYAKTNSVLQTNKFLSYRLTISPYSGKWSVWSVVVNQQQEYDDDGEQERQEAYITYAYIHYRLDPACNVMTRSVPRNGMYPVPRPHYKVTQMSFGKQEKKVDYVEHVDTAYSIKWTKANLQKIVKSIPLRREPKVSCSVIASNGIRIHVDSFQDLLDATSTHELLHFGRIPTDKERKRWLDELGGRVADQVLLTNIFRQGIERSIPEAPVTASQVERMLEQAQQQKQQQQS